MGLAHAIGTSTTIRAVRSPATQTTRFMGTHPITAIWGRLSNRAAEEVTQAHGAVALDHNEGPVLGRAGDGSTAVEMGQGTAVRLCSTLGATVFPALPCGVDVNPHVGLAGGAEDFQSCVHPRWFPTLLQLRLLRNTFAVIPVYVYGVRFRWLRGPATTDIKDARLRGRFGRVL